MSIWPASPDPVAPQMILAGGRFGLGVAIAGGQSLQNSGAITASTAFLYPLTIPERILVYKLFWAIAVTVASSTIDVGIYTEDYARIISTGSTAAVAGPALQEVDVADTVLDRGHYYLAVAGGTTPPNLYRSAMGTIQAAHGVARMAAAFPLPATVTPVSAINAFISVVGLACRPLAA